MAGVLTNHHVLLIVENNSVPFDRRVWQEALALAEYGAAVSIICPKADAFQLDCETLQGVRVFRYAPKWAGKGVGGYLLEYAWAWAQILRLIFRCLRRCGSIDVLHAANPPDIFWPIALLLRLRGTRFVFDEHDLAPLVMAAKFPSRAGRWLSSLLGWLERINYRVADAVIVTNQSFRRHALSACPGVEQKIFVVRNGPDTRFFRPRAPSIGLKGGRKYLAVYVGLMGKQDGVAAIVQAMHVLVGQLHYKDLTVYLVGDGDELPGLRKRIHAYGLQAYIRCPGILQGQALLDVLASADICLAPEPPDRLNHMCTMIKVMEYMAMGKPIVAFALKETRYTAGDAALYVTPAEPAAYARAMVRLLADAGLRQVMGRIGRERILKRLAWRHVRAPLYLAYTRILKAKGG